MRRSLAAAITAALLTGACWGGDSRSAIRQRLEAFAAHVNDAPAAGSEAEYAARTAGYFTEDVVVQLGDGSAPIDGRQMLLGMATRLQPRTADYRLRFEDVTVVPASDGRTADVTLTAEFIRRVPAARQSMDAREFKLTMRDEGGEWRIARVEGIATLK